MLLQCFHSSIMIILDNSQQRTEFPKWLVILVGKSPGCHEMVLTTGARKISWEEFLWNRAAPGTGPDVRPRGPGAVTDIQESSSAWNGYDNIKKFAFLELIFVLCIVDKTDLLIVSLTESVTNPSWDWGVRSLEMVGVGVRGGPEPERCQLCPLRDRSRLAGRREGRHGGGHHVHNRRLTQHGDITSSHDLISTRPGHRWVQCQRAPSWRITSLTSCLRGNYITQSPVNTHRIELFWNDVVEGFNILNLRDHFGDNWRIDPNILLTHFILPAHQTELWWKATESWYWMLSSSHQRPESRVQGVGHGILKFYLRLKPEQWLTKSQVGNKIFYGFQQREMSPNYYKLERIKENNCPSSCEISVFDLSACWRACLISRQLISAWWEAWLRWFNVFSAQFKMALSIFIKSQFINNHNQKTKKLQAGNLEAVSDVIF